MEEGIAPSVRVELFKTGEEAEKYMGEEVSEWISTRKSVKVDKMTNFITAYTDDETITLELEYHEI